MMTATYSPEDNKLRLYSLHRLDAETYNRVKAAGFRWAPKQELFVAPSWTPAREDLLLELCGEIGDEDYSPEERSADRAERFSNYRDKRRGEAGGHADRFESGPSVFGHQNARRAELQAKRHDRQRTNAVSQWSKAEYWQHRTAGVIRHALHKSSASVRRGRILTIEAELRKVIAEYTPTDNPPQYSVHVGWNDDEPSQHVWCGPKGRGGQWIKVKNLEAIKDANARWVNHYEMRLTYERAMLAEEGGTAAEAEIEVGGWFGNRQIAKVNKSNTTGRVVSIGIMVKTHGRDRWGNERANEPAERLEVINIERFAADAYRAPTDEEREAFKAATAKRKAEAKATTPKAPPLINPTDVDAERLLAIWNAKAKAKHDANPNARFVRDFEPATVAKMTQAQYSAISKGSYAKAETRTLHACGRLARRWSNMYTSEGKRYDDSLGESVCKLRIYGYRPERIVIITDKPQKPLPVDWERIADQATELAEAS